MADYSRNAGQALEVQAASELNDGRIAGMSFEVQAASALNDQRIAGASFEVQAASALNDDRIGGMSLQIFAIGPLIPLATEMSYLQGAVSPTSPLLQGSQGQLQGDSVSADIDLYN